MSHRRLRSGAPCGALLIVLALAGCGPSIREVDDMRVVDQSQLERIRFGEYWDATGFPDEARASGKIAIASFRIEFVTDRLTKPNEYEQTEFYTNYGRTLEKLPDDMYAMLARRFREHGADVLPIHTVQSAPAYKKYPEWNGPKKILIDDPLPSTAGRIRQLKVHSAGHLTIVWGPEDEIAAVDAELREQLGVETIVHVVVRVGVWRGHATIEEGCQVTVRSEQHTGKLTSQRALASKSSVLVNRGYAATTEGVYNVRSDRYESAMEHVFPAYMGLAANRLRK